MSMIDVQSRAAHKDGSTMKFKNDKIGRIIGRVAVLVLLALASGAGCATVSCDWPQTSFADDARSAAANRSSDPCRPDKADQYTIVPLFSGADGP